MSGVICYCLNCPGDEDKENSTCILKPGAQCFASIEEQFNHETKTFEAVYSAGCLPPDEQTLLQCKGDLVPSYYFRTIKCCNFTDFCNKNLPLNYKPRAPVSPPSILFEHFYLAPVIVSFAFCFVILFLCVTFLFFKYKKSEGSRQRLAELYSVKVQKCTNFQDFLNSSGSGAGKSLLLRTTIGQQVEKERFLGKGRFSEKWVVRWKEEKIVMKIFSTLEEDHWFREKSIYSTGLSHENVLGYVSADILPDGSRALFTYYHEIGSLQDYLKQRCLNDTELLTLARSAANGLYCLHTEVLCTFKRPAIVHRNITSKNFLVNNRHECVISDFEVALAENEYLDSQIDLRVGTPRYAAPEIVKETINFRSFSAFQQADVYSFGLVLWEMCRRYATVAEKYALPFANVLPDYPTMEDMKDLFATKNSIQDILGIPFSQEKDQALNIVTTIIRQVVLEHGGSRLTMLRISKRLKAL